MSEPMPPAQQPQAPQQSQQPQQSPRDWWFTAHRRFSTIGSALAIMMVFWIGLNILATEALRTLLGTDVPLGLCCSPPPDRCMWWPCR